ncbi:hypothetical protein [Actinomadura fibrosa]|uniref:Restriction endonuclease n=1 Tax=Actinomadura fibrosa TaxID=111802 RepID=A0ABW2Y172_9ACTN|nr:hypothetical protein [Actinomadura fibrosa]
MRQTAAATDGTLFTQGSLNDYLQLRLTHALQSVGEIPAEELQFSPQAVAERLIDEYRIDLVELHFGAMTRTPVTETAFVAAADKTPRGARLRRRPGQRMSLIVPFTGNPQLLTSEANTSRRGGGPQATLSENAVIFSVTAELLTEDLIHREIAKMRNELTERVQWANQDVMEWEPQFRVALEREVQRRKGALDHAATLSAALDIPLAPAPEEAQIHVPVRRKAVRIEQGPAFSGDDEPRLADEMYQDVLRTISGMSRAVERLPRTAGHLGEDGFRDLLLFVLNANYEGAARGEVFNCTGKTDILLNWKDRNAFIGECKRWRGKSQLTEAIDQLLGYTGWRDTKAALIVFIEGGSPSEIINKADTAIRAHPAFRSSTPSVDPDLRRDYLMTSPSDPHRYIKMAFLPVIVRSAGRSV